MLLVSQKLHFWIDANSFFCVAEKKKALEVKYCIDSHYSNSKKIIASKTNKKFTHIKLCYDYVCTHSKPVN